LALGLVVYDVLYLTLAAALYGGAIEAALRVHRALQPLPALLTFPAAALTALVALIAEVGLLSALCPRLRAGRFPFMKSAVFWGWLLRSMLRRVLLLPSLKWILFNSNVLRWLSLRAMGARVAFTANISSDVDLLDPQLIEIGAGAILGSRCGLTAHYVLPGLLVLDPIVVGAGAVLAGEVGVGPGCVVGERALIKPRCTLNVGAKIGARAEVGPAATVDALGSIGEDAHVGTLAYVPVRGVVIDDAHLGAQQTATP
jgi:acetyltransferase-like isoleucine patch superfamily enzyme